MKIRKSIVPSHYGDLCSIAFLLIMIPLVYYFEVFIVLPQLYESSSLWFLVHFLWGTFSTLNLISNYVATIVIDTSVKNNIVPDFDSVSDICTVCKIPAPARSWHCSKCDECILKRDHHCIFIGYCVGHINHRYFIWLLFYLFIGTLQGSYLNIFFVKNNFNCNPFVFLKLIFPLSFFLFGFEENINHSYLILIATNFVGMIVTGILLWFHTKLILNGTTCHEDAKNLSAYNIGFRDNIKRVLGERWYLTWISAFIDSKLLEDGSQWNSKMFNSSNKNS